jgi:hypothetical protein
MKFLMIRCMNGVDSFPADLVDMASRYPAARMGTFELRPFCA